MIEAQTGPERYSSWIQTPEMQLYPLFEVHPTQYNPKLLPQDSVAGLFIEEASGLIANVPANLFDLMPQSRGLLEYVRDNQIPIMVGDCAVPASDHSLETILALGLPAGAAGLVYSALKAKGYQPSRREMMRLSGIGLSTAALGLTGVFRTEMATGVLGTAASVDTYAQSPLTRGLRDLQRSIAAGDHHDLRIHYRNLVMMYKMRFAASQIGEDKRKPRIISIVGHGHSGTLDYADTPLDQLRTMVGTFYKPALLQKIISMNQGVQAFASTVSVQLTEKNQFEKTFITDKALIQILAHQGIS